MLTIENKLLTHLVVPDGIAKGLALKLAPGATGKVEAVTATLKDAEAAGHVLIRYPGAPKTKVETPAPVPAKADKPNGKARAKKEEQPGAETPATTE